MKRKVSWVLASLADIAPPTWAYFEQASVYGELQDQHGYVCGLPMLSIILIACLVSGGLSFMSFAFGYAAFHSLPKPRSFLRIAELVVLVLPFFCSIGMIFLLLAY